jgi:hypothetical protein
MHGSDLKDDVRWLLARVTRAPEQPFPGGAGEAELVDLARRVGADLPDDLVAWLRVCKGEAIGPGGVFGARPDQEAVDVATWSAAHPGWRAEGWRPSPSGPAGVAQAAATQLPATVATTMPGTGGDQAAGRGRAPSRCSPWPASHHGRG